MQRKIDAVHDKAKENSEKVLGVSYVDKKMPAELHPRTEKRFRDFEGRLDLIEDFLNHAMGYFVYRGKETQNQLEHIEQSLRSSMGLAKNNNTSGGGNAATPQRGRPGNKTTFTA